MGVTWARPSKLHLFAPLSGGWFKIWMGLAPTVPTFDLENPCTKYKKKGKNTSEFGSKSN